MNLTKIKKEQSYFETLIVRLLKTEIALQYSIDECWDDNTATFLNAFMDLRNAIEKEYGDSYPYTLKIKEQGDD